MPMPETESCSHCTFDIPISWSYCPHCARPGLYPNVRQAATSEEQNALQKRFGQAKQDAKTRTADTALERFEREIDERSQAVINRRFSIIDRLSSSDRELYSTFYKLLDSDLKLPVGDKWDRLRPVAERAMFPGYEREIRFAALTLDGAGVASYGSCSIVLRTDMIAHRASVFEENCVLFMDHQDIRIADAHLLPPGYRATWKDRAKLCAAKLSSRIRNETRPEDFPSLLLRQGQTSEDDDFVEVHIWGSFSIRAVERVIISGKKRQKRRLKALGQRLAKMGVSMEVK